MGMLDWFKSIMQGDDKSAATATAATALSAADEKGAEVAGLNFKTAVDAHMKWKVRLESYINGTSTEQLKVEVVSRDDQCPLGKWIHDVGGEKFGYSETFFDMKAHHAHFHRCAGEVLEAAQAGETAKATKLLQSGDYIKASERVKMLLARMFILASDGREAIDSHLKWKERLTAYIKGESKEELQVDKVSRDDMCPLGYWLNGIGGERFGTTPAYSVLKSRHAHFHRCAGEVLSVAQQGERDKALQMLEQGAYPDASQQVAAAVVTLFEGQKKATP
ncbi:MAG: CZB domain-containing protein [Sulfuritalea sp.]|nr:CZB domain-containing protein [Sulfuritalea sp.]MDP1983160.1 CZB domain-containing protein [Sulfuritalea sp.]